MAKFTEIMTSPRWYPGIKRGISLISCIVMVISPQTYTWARTGPTAGTRARTGTGIANGISMGNCTAMINPRGSSITVHSNGTSAVCLCVTCPRRVIASRSIAADKKKIRCHGRIDDKKNMDTFIRIDPEFWANMRPHTLVKCSLVDGSVVEGYLLKTHFVEPTGEIETKDGSECVIMSPPKFVLKTTPAKRDPGYAEMIIKHADCRSVHLRADADILQLQKDIRGVILAILQRITD